jgi:D-serine deaminase-like pyridoxal phosphate-dependent protein
MLGCCGRSLSATTGSVKTAAAGSAYRFITRNFVVILATMSKKTSSPSATRVTDKSTGSSENQVWGEAYRGSNPPGLATLSGRRESLARIRQKSREIGSILRISRQSMGGIKRRAEVGGSSRNLPGRAMIGAAMAANQIMLSEFTWDPRYSIARADEVLTPVLVIYPEIVVSNIERTLDLLGGDANSIRVHIKTAKLGYTIRLLVDRNIRAFKCATTLELLTACENGAEDVLFAYPAMGANGQRAAQIADQFPDVRISVLAENLTQLRQWQSTRVGIFLDINPGMNRTGIEQERTEKVVSVLRRISELGLEFRGLHYYDGQYGGLPWEERMRSAHAGYDRLLELVREITREGFSIPEVVTAGTPTFPCSLAYSGFRRQAFIHRVSPGTVIYGDATSLAQLPRDYGYAPAALVVARVVSQPSAVVITCDAGHKAVSADAGVPTCLVIGNRGLTALSPSEEHLPFATAEGSTTPRVGDLLYLLPRHICPTVNNFDRALIVRDGHIEAEESVSARGHESPLLEHARARVAL